MGRDVDVLGIDNENLFTFADKVRLSYARNGRQNNMCPIHIYGLKFQFMENFTESCFIVRTSGGKEWNWYRHLFYYSAILHKGKK